MNVTAGSVNSGEEDRVFSPLLFSGESSRPQSVLGLRTQGIEIKHGLLPDYSFRVKSHIHTVLFQPQLQSSVVHHASGYGRYGRGLAEDEFESEGCSKIERLLRAEKHSLYIGMCKYHIKVCVGYR